DDFFRPEVSLVAAQQSVTGTPTSIDVSATNQIVFGASGAHTVTSLTNGVAGQEITCIFGNGNTTIQDNSSINLAGGVDFTGAAGDTLTLVFSGTSWFEKC